ncbi:MAG: CHASE domain-containing protein [Gammaproteobacteria bacterium]|nr:CHASE domain-containing protein [Gammaproteobacteria bacterium]MBU0848292.1 CHASE domain-containing protein [Gammaproteobacteria bacterium]MBU1266985.1 CHASE domain-containing protein [Gammaproteobacteria bacterium]MBU1529574.1 CHASE domain-containing protein [Gammaproteobacteria bacterium]MBU1781155.1 CHASE domain-containing protein [Gammaproteobacteria bacterium]
MKKTLVNWMYAALAGAAGMAMTTALLLERHHNSSSAQLAVIEAQVNQKTHELQRMVNRYEETLRLTATSISTYGQGQVNQTQFRTYVESLDLKKEFPGTLGMAFVRKVPVKDEAAFVKNMRMHEAPDFQIKFISPSSQDRFVIQYIEPLSENHQAQGLDLGSENSRRENSLNAFTRMGLSASRPITMIQNAHIGRQGFTMLMPVFRLPEPSKDLGLRYEELIGWIAFPMSIDRMVKPWLSQEPGLQARISMVENIAEPTLFFDNVDPSSITLHAHQGIRRNIQLGNRHWLLEFWPEKPQEAGLQPITWLTWILIGGLFGLLIAVWVKKQLDRRDAMLLQTELVNNSSEALIAEDTEGRILVWNRAAEELFGHDQASVLYEYERNLILPDELKASEKRLHQRAKEGETLKNIETVRLNNADRIISLSMNLTPIYNNRKTLIGFTKSFRDITEDRRIWKDMHMLEELISYAPDGVLTLDHSRKIKFANPAAMLLLQDSEIKPTLVGLCITDLLAPDLRIDFENQVLNPLFNHGRVHVMFDWSTPENEAFQRLTFRGISLSRSDTGESSWGLRFEKTNHSNTKHFNTL